MQEPKELSSVSIDYKNISKEQFYWLLLETS